MDETRIAKEHGYISREKTPEAAFRSNADYRGRIFEGLVKDRLAKANGGGEK